MPLLPSKHISLYIYATLPLSLFLSTTYACPNSICTSIPNLNALNSIYQYLYARVSLLNTHASLFVRFKCLHKHLPYTNLSLSNFSLSSTTMLLLPFSLITSESSFFLPNLLLLFNVYSKGPIPTYLPTYVYEVHNRMYVCVNACKLESVL